MMGSSYTTGGGSPFDIAAQQKAISTTMATLPKDQHGNLIFDYSQSKGATIALVARMTDHVEIVGWVVPPLKGKSLDYGGSVRVNWLLGQPKTPALVERVRTFVASVRGWYELLSPWNPPFAAAFKAVMLSLGFNARLVWA
jgi:hypothetical protein